ncbi:MAG TPA: discoidin domain-containing protein [Candidatus Acidoferrum sp.]|nr:discoidin domain-containing protein [Candidatus Acidoferrum sp.]
MNIPLVRIVSRCAAARWVVLVLGVPALAGAAPAEPQLGWDSTDGVVLRTPQSTVRLDGKGAGSLLVRFFPGNDVVSLRSPRLSMPKDQGLRLRYDVEAQDGARLMVERDVQARRNRDGLLVLEIFTLTPEQPLTNDIELELPFALSVPTNSAGPSVMCPLKNGWARSFNLRAGDLEAEYRLGNFLTGKETPALALPLVVLPAKTGAAAVFADPMFSTLFSLHSAKSNVEGVLRFRYAAGKVPISAPESRAFAVWLPNTRSAKEQFPAAVDAWFRFMMPNVRSGPAWLHDIAMVGFDFLSDDGKGWDRDVRLLADWIKPSDRHRVALCLHGWYDALGSYCYEPQAHRMKDEWVAFERTRKVYFTQAELKRRLRLARDLGFRVLLYYADGVAADSGVAGYRDDWSYRDAKGNRITGWQGPDTFGPTYMRDLGNPEVVTWYTNYMAALLETYGTDLDGLVWDETFHASLGQISPAPHPAYCDRNMMRLVRELTQQVHAFDPQKAFLASDCVGAYGWDTVPGYAMMADGTYQDSHCDPRAWSYGLFPNWRNTLWSCNWFDISDFQRTRWGVENFGAPVAISNGWGNDCGPSEWTPRERDAFLRLFHERLKMKPPSRFLTADPEALLATSPDVPGRGDPIPEPGTGEVNWALAANGSRASASSQEASGNSVWPASGVIDGRRDDAAWGAGHGWASKAGEPLPQWLEVDFGQPRSVSRFVVLTYEKDKGPETAAKWGVQDYMIEVWDKRKRRWEPVVRECPRRVVKARVHKLARPVETDKFRIVISEVAPLDGQARLLQLEAWGR